MYSVLDAWQEREQPSPTNQPGNEEGRPLNRNN